MPILLLILVGLAWLWWNVKGDREALQLGEKVLNAERARGVHPDLYVALNEWETSGPFPIRVAWRGGLRTDLEQLELYASGRTLPGAVVTNAATVEDSPHGRGAALDLVPVDGNGDTLPKTDARWESMIAWWKARGFVSGQHFPIPGGDWPHVELKDWRELPYPPPDYSGGANG